MKKLLDPDKAKNFITILRYARHCRSGSRASRPFGERIDGSALPPADNSMSFFEKAAFLASVGALSELPAEGPPEFAVAGRSNVGKSSAINTLVSRKRLAFASKTPGRTQTLNFYDLGDRARLIDLPGYGYAKVPLALRSHWEHLVGGFLQRRERLAGVIIVMDARHPFAAADERLLEWLSPLLRRRALRVALLLAKSDKLTRTEAAGALATAAQRLAGHGLRGEVLLFSSLTGEGVGQARVLIEAWLESGSPVPAAERPVVAGGQSARGPSGRIGHAYRGSRGQKNPR